jgi:tripartite-type tricarboxylate transporter receptor subunit TctC
MSRIALAVLCLVASFQACAQAYPARSVKIVVPFGAGGSADVYARFMGARLSDALGQPFVVENRPGGGAVVGSDAVAKSSPDGYTLLMMSNTHTVNETLIPKKPYDLMRDLAPISGVNYQDLLLAVNAAVPAGNLREFIALAKSKPGRLNYASSGPGTPYHLAGELFKSMAKVDITHVPYKGNVPAITDLLSGQLTMVFATMPTVLPHVKAGKLKALAVIGPVRNPAVPDMPTVAETLPGFEVNNWVGIFAPAGTPPEIVRALNAEIVKAMASPEIKARLATEGARFTPNTPEQFAAFVRKEVTDWGKVIKAANITAE